jgi:hypothetical protein
MVAVVLAVMGIVGAGSEVASSLCAWAFLGDGRLRGKVLPGTEVAHPVQSADYPHPRDLNPSELQVHCETKFNAMISLNARQKALPAINMARGMPAHF